MSRSRKRLPITGLTTAESDKTYKQAEHQRERSALGSTDIWQPLVQREGREAILVRLGSRLAEVALDVRNPVHQRLALFVFVTAGLVMYPVPTRANRYADNDDQFLDRKRDLQFNAIGQVETVRQEENWKKQLGNGVGTAFLVSPCYILTNHHVVFGDEYPLIPKNDEEKTVIFAKYAMKFSVGVGVSLPFVGKVTATPVVWGDRDGANRDDWALLKLSSCVGSRSEIGWMEADIEQSLTRLIDERQWVALASYPSDRGDAEDKFVGKSLRIAYGRVTGIGNNYTVRFSASGAPGSSGGVIMIAQSGQPARVIGMYRGASGRRLDDPEDYLFRTYSESYSNEFLNIADIIRSKNVRDLIIQDRLKFGHPNPNYQNLSRGIPAKEVFGSR